MFEKKQLVGSNKTQINDIHILTLLKKLVKKAYSTAEEKIILINKAKEDFDKERKEVLAIENAKNMFIKIFNNAPHYLMEDLPKHSTNIFIALTNILLQQENNIFTSDVENYIKCLYGPYQLLEGSNDENHKKLFDQVQKKLNQLEQINNNTKPSTKLFYS